MGVMVGETITTGKSTVSVSVGAARTASDVGVGADVTTLIGAWVPMAIAVGVWLAGLLGVWVSAMIVPQVTSKINPRYANRSLIRTGTGGIDMRQ